MQLKERLNRIGILPYLVVVFAALSVIVPPQWSKLSEVLDALIVVGILAFWLVRGAVRASRGSSGSK